MTEERILEITNAISEDDLSRGVKNEELVECVRYWSNAFSKEAGLRAVSERMIKLVKAIVQ